MEDSVDFGWDRARSFYGMVGLGVEHKSFDWANKQELLKLRLTHSRTIFPAEYTKQDKPVEKPPVKTCASYQIGTCDQLADHLRLLLSCQKFVIPPSWGRVPHKTIEYNKKRVKGGSTSTPPTEGATKGQTTQLSCLTLRDDKVSSPGELHFRDQTLQYNSHKVNTSNFVSDRQASVEGSAVVAHVQPPEQHPPSRQGPASTTNALRAHGQLQHKLQTSTPPTEGATHRQTGQLPSRTIRDNAVPSMDRRYSREQTLPRNSHTVNTSDFVLDHQASVEGSGSEAHIQPPEQHAPTTKGPACTFNEFRAHGRLEPPHSRRQMANDIGPCDEDGTLQQMWSSSSKTAPYRGIPEHNSYIP